MQDPPGSLIPPPLLQEAFPSAALRALLREAAATPKPGLVDRRNNGAHRDMGFYTFLDSAIAIAPYFGRMAAAGAEPGADAKTLLASIRPIGIAAERAMNCATGGVNTHKGAIFSLGVLSAAAGLVLSQNGSRRAEDLLGAAAKIPAPAEKELGRLLEAPATNGERLYREQGVAGVRGEAAAGFPEVRDRALPLMRRLRREGKHGEDEILLQVLLTLMASVTDTNLLSRGGAEGLSFAQREAGRILALGGALCEEGRAALGALDLIFIERNLSPGGCADLLALTVFLERWESGER